MIRESGGEDSPHGPRERALRLLLVHDRPRDARRIEDRLDRTGLHFELRTRNSLEDGADLLRPEEVDVLILHPGGSGGPDPAALRRAARAAGDIPVLVLTDPAEVSDPDDREDPPGRVTYVALDTSPPGTLARAVRRAAQRARRDPGPPAKRDVLDGALDALPQHVAILDGDGRILEVNEAWLDFARREGGDRRGYVGENYLEVTASAAEADEDAARMLEGLRAVLVGERTRFEMEYPCHTPDSSRWFHVAATSILGVSSPRTVVSHTEITDRVHRERELEERTAALRERVKERECLHHVSAILHDTSDPLDRRLQAAVDRIPRGWQYPEATVARLEIGAGTWTSGDARGAGPSLRAEVRLEGEEPGVLEVAYREDRPPSDIGPFLEEERELLGEIAEQIGVTVARHRAQLKREESEQKYRSVVEHHPDSVYSFDLDGVIQSVSPATERITGFDADGLVGTDFTRTVAPEYREEIWRHFRAAARGEPRSYETVGVTPEGDRRHFQITNLPIVVDDEVRGVFGIARDITARKRAEQELRESEERWATAFEMAPTGILISEADTGRFLSVNQVAAGILGFEPGELVGRTSREIECWQDFGRRDELVRKIRSQGSVEGEEAWLRSRDGDLRYARISARALEIQGRNRILWTVEDRTEERRREEALRRSEARFRALFEDSRDPIVILDGDGRILQANDTARQLSGYGEGEIVGREIAHILGEPEDWREFREILESAGGVSDFETRLRTRAGDLRVVQASASVHSEPYGDRIQIIFRDVTERRQLEQDLRYRALHDPLTGLANRSLFRDRLGRALARSDRRGEPCGLVLLDISRFKQINDSLGHTAGDRILEEVGRRLENHVREEDTAARFGGDEFAVILGLLEHPDAVAGVVGRLLDTLRTPYAIDGREIEIDFHVGAVVHCTRDAPRTVEVEHPDELVRCADLALIRAKRKSGEFVHLFHPDEDSRKVDLLNREQDLRRGVNAQEFEVFFQPVIELDSGRVWGCEALARWRHPERGLVSPGEFIPLAEETDIIHDLGDQIALRAFHHAAGWTEEMGDRAPHLLLNISGRQFESDRFADSLDHCFQASGLSPDRVYAEVTESTVIRATNRVRRLREHGLGVLIDDFGTGYSSLHYLRDLEVDGLKIDMSFVQPIVSPGNSSAIVQTILTLGRQLEILTVAEGVETEAQRDRLEEMGTRLAQGFHLARPIPAEEMRTRLRAE